MINFTLMEFKINDSADLKPTLFNKTGPERTSFAFWATLNVTDSDGNMHDPIHISGCSGPVERKTEPSLTFPDKITCAWQYY